MLEQRHFVLRNAQERLANLPVHGVGRGQHLKRIPVVRVEFPQIIEDGIFKLRVLLDAPAEEQFHFVCFFDQVEDECEVGVAANAVEQAQQGMIVAGVRQRFTHLKTKNHYLHNQFPKSDKNRIKIQKSNENQIKM